MKIEVSDSSQSYYELAVLAEQQGDFTEAIKKYQQAISLKPNYTEAYFRLGQLYQKKGNLSVAIQAYRRVIQYDKKNITAYESCAKILTQLGKPQEALEVYEEAINNLPQVASLYEKLASLLQTQNQIVKAIVAYRQALTLEPSLTISLYNLGRLCLSRGNYQNAEECFRQLITFHPNIIEPYSYCARALLLQGKLEQAVDYLRQVIIRQPEFVDFFCHHYGSRNPQEFIDTINFSLVSFLKTIIDRDSSEKINQNLQDIYGYLGTLWQNYWANELAEEYYKYALAINPAKIELYLSLGKVLERQEKHEAAIAVYHLGLNFDPAHPQLNYALAQVLEKQKQFEPAIKYYEKVLKLQLNAKVTSLQISPAFENLPNYPQGIYLYTEDWMQPRGLTEYYLPVTWGEKGTKTIDNLRILSPAKQKTQDNCEGVNCLSCISKIANSFQPIEVTEKVFFCSQKNPVLVEQPPTFVATIPQGRIWVTPYQDTLQMCKEIAVITPDNYLLRDLSWDYPWRLAGCKEHSPAVHKIFTLEEMAPVEYINGTVAVFSCLSAHIYYHWLLELVPRVGILRASGIDFEKIDWFLVNSVGKRFQRETLDILGIPKEKIIESDSHPHIQAGKLIVPSFAGHLGSPRAFTLQFLRDKFLTPTLTPSPERIYVSRNRAKYRQVVNDTKVRELLSQYGFTTVFLEDFSLREQAALFAQAKIIVAPHGAGLANLIFCRKGTKVIEIFSPNYTRTYYLAISNLLGLKHYYLLGDNFSCDFLRNLMYKSTLFEDIFVNLDYLEAIIQKIQ